MSTPVTRRKHISNQNISLLMRRYQNVGMQSTIKYTILKSFVSIISKNCLWSFRCNQEIV